MPESKYLIRGQAVTVMTVYFYVEIQLEQMYNFVGTAKYQKKPKIMYEYRFIEEEGGKHGRKQNIC